MLAPPSLAALSVLKVVLPTLGALILWFVRRAGQQDPGAPNVRINRARLGRPGEVIFTTETQRAVRWSR
jgi:hypothetical protein